MAITKQRPKKNAERLKVLEEFEFAVATPQACAIADALIQARKDSARLDEILKRAAPVVGSFPRWLITFPHSTTDVTPDREAIDRAMISEPRA